MHKSATLRYFMYKKNRVTSNDREKNDFEIEKEIYKNAFEFKVHSTKFKRCTNYLFLHKRCCK